MRPLGIILALAAAIAVAALPACSKKTTAPPGGGGTPELNSGSIAASGGSFQHTFATAGEFPYHCSLHAAMTGNKVTVSSTSVNPSAVVNINDATSNGFAPKTVDIQPGGFVRWVNNDGVAHTVTSGN